MTPNCSLNHGVTFLYPTENQFLNYQDTINVSWISPFPNPLLYTFCYNATSGPIQESEQNAEPFNGSQLVHMIWTGIDNCMFDLRPNTSACYGWNSPYVQVVLTAKATPTTLGLPVSSSTTSSTSTTSSSTSTTTSSTSTSTASGTELPSTSNPLSSKSGLSSGAKAGIGVGVAVIAVAALVGLAFFFLRRRKSSNIPLADSTALPAHHLEYYGQGKKYQHVGSEGSDPGSYVQMQHMGQKPSELSAEGGQTVAELPGGEVRHELS